MRKKTKSNKYTIYCPQCHRRVAEWDGKYSSNVIAGCRKCHKKIVYHTGTGVTDIKPWEPRRTASGMTYL